MTKQVLLSFDIEEFDLPKEHGAEISLEAGVAASKQGTEKILKILKRQNVRATFFVTGNFAKLAPETVRQILSDGHEVAAHGVDHFHPQKSDIKEAKKLLENITKTKIVGWRQPRMQKIDYCELEHAGYLYDSSLNPAFIPGRYNNLKVPRHPFRKTNAILEIPASVATPLRIPLFWLALHLFPLQLYIYLAKLAIKHDGLFTTYFHPWEFINLSPYPSVPSYIKLSSGKQLEQRLEQLIIALKKQGADFKIYKNMV